MLSFRAILVSFMVSRSAAFTPPILRNRGWTSPRFFSQSTTTETITKSSSIDNLKHPVILFDGVCNFCNTWVDLLLRIDTNQRYKFAPLQSEIGRDLLVRIGREPDDISSVVLVEPPEYTAYFKSSCVLRVVEELGPVATVASKAAEALVPLGIRDTIYDTVAENRYNFMGKRDECRCGDPQFADRFLS